MRHSTTYFRFIYGPTMCAPKRNVKNTTHDDKILPAKTLRSTKKREFMVLMLSFECLSLLRFACAVYLLTEGKPELLDKRTCNFPDNLSDEASPLLIYHNIHRKGNVLLNSS